MVYILFRFRWEVYLILYKFTSKSILESLQEFVKMFIKKYHIQTDNIYFIIANQFNKTISKHFQLNFIDKE